jgi:hypothetical protein
MRTKFWLRSLKGRVHPEKNKHTWEDFIKMDIRKWVGWKMLNLNSVNHLIVVMVKCGVLFEVRTGFLNNI